MNLKLMQMFMDLGCPNRKIAAAVLQVYFDLCERKKYWDVEYFYSEALKCIYLTGKITKSSEKLYFVPFPANDKISFNDMQNYLSLNEGGTKSIFLAFVDSDSMCVYYEISKGIDDLTPKTKEISVEEKRTNRDRDLETYRPLLEKSALSNTAITIGNTNKNTNCLEK